MYVSSLSLSLCLSVCFSISLCPSFCPSLSVFLSFTCVRERPQRIFLWLGWPSSGVRILEQIGINEGSSRVEVYVNINPNPEVVYSNSPVSVSKVPWRKLTWMTLRKPTQGLYHSPGLFTGLYVFSPSPSYPIERVREYHKKIRLKITLDLFFFLVFLTHLNYIEPLYTQRISGSTVELYTTV